MKRRHGGATAAGESRGGRWLRIAAPAAIVMLGFAVYIGTLNAPFIFDDYNAIVENPNIRSLWPPLTALSAPAQSTVAGRPVVALSLALNHAVSGLEPWSYHLFNIMLYVLSGLLLYAVVRRVLAAPWSADVLARGIPPGWRPQQPAARRAPKADDDDPPGPVWALAVALIWLLHPLNTEVVTYVSTRTEGLVGLFYLLTLYAVVRSGVGLGRRRLWEVPAVVACALAMASKEVAAPLPLLVLLFDGVFLCDGYRDALRRRPGMYTGLAATWLILLALVAQGSRSETVGLHFDFLTPLDYARTQAGVIWHYLRLAVWPGPLVIDYHDWPIARSFSAAVWLGLVPLLGLAATSVWLAVRRSWVGFLGCWFFLILAPTSSLIPITSEVAAERRMYLPLMAIVALALAGLWWLAGRLGGDGRGRIFAVCVVPIAVVLAGLTIDRNRDYDDEVTIWQDAVRKRPSSLRAIENLGASLVSHGRREEAIVHLEKALRINPDSKRALENLGLIRLDQGRLPEALDLLERCALMQPGDGLSRLNLAKAMVATGDTEGAASVLQEAVRLLPESADAHARLGSVLAERGQLDLAREETELAVRLEPDSPEIRLMAARVDLLSGELDGAIVHYQKVLSLDSDQTAGSVGLITALSRSDDDEQAEQLLGRLVGTSPDPRRVAGLATSASETVDPEAALDVMRIAVRKWPDSAELQLSFGRLLVASQRSADALAAYRAALRLRPRWADAANSLAQLWATAEDPSVRNPAEALRLARELSATAGDRHPILLGTLGVALASAGQRTQGEDALARAAALAANAGQPALAEELGRQLKLVREGWPPPPG